MKKNMIFLAIIVISLSLTGCTLFGKLFEPVNFTADNSPINVPSHPLYALGELDNGQDMVAIIDADKDSLVGVDTVASPTEEVGGLTVGPQGYLFVTITDRKGSKKKDMIRVIDPATGEHIKDIILNNYCPRSIYRISNNICLVQHSLLSWGDSLFACDVLDLNAEKVVKTLKLRGIVDGIIKVPETGKYYLAVYDPLDSVPGSNSYESGRYYDFDISSYSVSGEYFVHESEIIPTFIDDTTFVCYAGSLYISYYDFPAGNFNEFREIGRISVGSGDYLLDIEFIKSFLYLTAKGNDKMLVFDPFAKQVVKQINVLSEPKGIFYFPNTDKIYVTSDYNRISVVDPNTDKMIDSISGGEYGNKKWQNYQSLYMP